MDRQACCSPSLSSLEPWSRLCWSHYEKSHPAQAGNLGIPCAPFDIGRKRVELGHTGIVNRGGLRGEETRNGARYLSSRKGNVFVDVRTFVLLARHGAQPLLGFPQYTILVGQARCSTDKSKLKAPLGQDTRTR